MKQAILELIARETLEIQSSLTFEEKSSRINNVIQLKINSNISEISNDIYVDVKNFITFYIKSLEEKQFNYDEFNATYIIGLIERFDVEQQCNLLEHALKVSKDQHILEKATAFKDLLHKKMFFREWKKFKWRNLMRLIFAASVYNGWTILISLFLCFLFCFIIYLPAPACGIVLFSSNYQNVSETYLLNHACNVLMSFFDIQANKFILPVNPAGTIILVLIKVFIISILVNVLLNQYRSRFKI